MSLPSSDMIESRRLPETDKYYAGAFIAVMNICIFGISNGIRILTDIVLISFRYFIPKRNISLYIGSNIVRDIVLRLLSEKVKIFFWNVSFTIL